MTAPTLRDLFRRALKASVIAPLALVSCGPDVSKHTPLQCDASGFSVRDLNPPVIPDVISLRMVSGRSFDPEAKPFELSSTGTACLTATDAPSCQAAFDALAPSSGFGASCGQICVDYFLATTKGDEVKAVTSLEALKTFLGDIDTAQEAMLIAFANNYNMLCGTPDQGSAKADGDGWEVLAVSGSTCGAGTKLMRHYLSVARDGSLKEKSSEVIEYGSPGCVIGRRPPGLVSNASGACDEVLGQFFAASAHLEGASVPAFERLAAELAALGAPRELQQWALISALEEVAHTRTTARLARRFGALPMEPVVEDRPLRGAFELALDNAVEGCVRETFGALVAQHQALHAQDDEVRAAMVQIADDETRHAELSWAMNAWLLEQLSEDERRVVERVRTEAVRALAEELEAPVDEALVTQVGMPRPEVAQRMLVSLFA